MREEDGKLIITTDRSGTIQEITSFLFDLEAAYISLYQINETIINVESIKKRFPLEFLLDFYNPEILIGSNKRPLSPFEVPPPDRLILNRVRIESPGFWEFVGGLNPLKHIREYLNDRHKRRQDREYREQSEQERLNLENELLRIQIFEKQNSVLASRVGLYKQVGYSDEKIRRLLWTDVGLPLSQLGRHQDTKLIKNSPTRYGDDA